MYAIYDDQLASFYPNSMQNLRMFPLDYIGVLGAPKSKDN